MRIEIDKPHVEALIAKFPERAGLEAQLRFGDRVELDLTRLSGAEFDFLEDLYRRSGPELHARAAQLATLRSAFGSEGRRFEAADLEDLFPRGRGLYHRGRGARLAVCGEYRDEAASLRGDALRLRPGLE